MGNKHKILIVDDEKISLRMTDHILSSEYETICASSGKEAIEIFKEQLPDLVPCFYWIMMCEDSVEELIYDTLKERKDFTDELFVENC